MLIARELRKIPGKARVWLPMFICNIVPEIFRAEGVDSGFYEVRPNLLPDIDDLEEKVHRGRDVVLVVNYYGFPQPGFVYDRLLDLAGGLIVDGVQSFLPLRIKNEENRLWIIQGFRKQLPVPDGVVLSGPVSAVAADRMRTSPGQRANILWRLSGLILRTIIDRFPNRYLEEMERDCFSRELRTRQFPGPAPMSRLSRIMMKRIDFEYIISRRQANYRMLEDGLRKRSSVALVDMALGPGTSPYVFPLLVPMREAMMKRLRDAGISSAVLWDRPKALAGMKSAMAKPLWSGILTLPIGHSYDRGDMERIIEAIVP